MGHAKAGGALVEYGEWLDEYVPRFEVWCCRARIPEYRSLGSLQHDVKPSKKVRGKVRTFDGVCSDILLHRRFPF